MPLVLNIPVFWIAKDCEYVSGSECARVLNIPGFCICSKFWICQNSEYTRILNMTKYVSVTQGSECPSVISKYAMPEYPRLCME